jgi:DNA-binding NarL/FixJ family response regulator
MTDISAATSPLTIAILSQQSLVLFGLQKILESSATVPMVVHPQRWRTADGFHPETRPDVVILDLETERDILSTIKQIREVSPTSKIVLLCGLEDKDRTREAFAAGVDGIILKVQPPAVMLAVIEALYPPAKPQAHREREGALETGLETILKKQIDADTQTPAWPDALTEREREIIGLVGQELSNKDIVYKLSISDSTVRHHMTSIFDKVGVPNRQKLLIHTHQFRATPV